jgi:predicted RNA-binding Zn-ribbon protein involved in translation (DUF1610 family)
VCDLRHDEAPLHEGERVTTSDDQPATDAPLRCPFCGSAAIAAASGKVSASTYWRCEKCAQLWNPERLRLHWHATRVNR